MTKQSLVPKRTSGPDKVGIHTKNNREKVTKTRCVHIHTKASSLCLCLWVIKKKQTLKTANLCLPLPHKVTTELQLPLSKAWFWDRTWSEAAEPDHSDLHHLHTAACFIWSCSALGYLRRTNKVLGLHIKTQGAGKNSDQKTKDLFNKEKPWWGGKLTNTNEHEKVRRTNQPGFEKHNEPAGEWNGKQNLKVSKQLYIGEDTWGGAGEEHRKK